MNPRGWCPLSVPLSAKRGSRKMDTPISTHQEPFFGQYLGLRTWEEAVVGAGMLQFSAASFKLRCEQPGDGGWLAKWPAQPALRSDNDSAS